MPRKNKAATVSTPADGMTRKQRKRMQRIIAGRGGYKDVMRGVGNAALSAWKGVSPMLAKSLGTGAANALGAPELAVPFTIASRNIFDKLTRRVVGGRGSYTLNDYAVNDLFVSQNQRPRLAGETATSFRTSCTIPFGDIVTNTGTTALTLTKPLTVGLLGCGEARGFQEWKLEQAFIEFVSGLGDGTAGAEGMITIFHVQNPNLPPPADYMAASRLADAVECRVGDNALCGIECKGSTWLNVRDGTTDVVDKSNTDYGYIGFFVNQAAALATTRVGRWELHATVSYRYPRSDPDVYGFLHVTSSSVTSAAPLGTTNVVTQSYGAFIGAVVTSTSVSFPNAQIGHNYLVQYTAVFGATAAVTAPTVSATQMTLLSIFQNGLATAAVAPQAGANAGNVSVTVAVRVDDMTPNIPKITYGSATLPLSPVAMDLTVTALPANIAASSLT